MNAAAARLIECYQSVHIGRRLFL